MDWNTLLAHITWASALTVVVGFACLTIGLVAGHVAIKRLDYEFEKIRTQHAEKSWYNDRRKAS